MGLCLQTTYHVERVRWSSGLLTIGERGEYSAWLILVYSLIVLFWLCAPLLLF
ncbi:hypothetical protein BDW42DRAFT_166154 [Aspergillus taichungensis]|uniref:Uncharacterized protein n=1 Tax=Aspergillus taichungensis TaxID=482145 RepID=A0A2J5HZ79_9EURO|nr:hypothetical protein BDW42DRAFT_166154 [Aspergillus taichungensis]